MKVFYWSPYLSHVATITAVLNSTLALKKYSKKNIDISIINSSGEWNFYKKELEQKKIDILDIFKKEYFQSLPRFGFIKSRYSYIKIFLLSFLSLKNLIKNKKPDFIIIHLITSLPIIINFFFNFETKFILRISGYPKLNILRKFLWKTLGKKLFKVVCPTKATKEYLIKEKIFDEKKIFVLKDPIINSQNINRLKKEQINNNLFKKKKYLLSIGRLSKQKNFLFLIKCFSLITKKYPEYDLVIIGEGELKNLIEKYINHLDLNQKITILPFQNNVFNYLKKSECFILSSLWEDPGFVIVEAASVNIPIISSNCPNGPVEFLSNGNGGYLFDNNNTESFLKTFDLFMSASDSEKKKKIIKAKKETKDYSSFRHYLALSRILS